MPYPELKGLLTDIGTEELGHLEMVGTLVHQLTRKLSDEQIKAAGFDAFAAFVSSILKKASHRLDIILERSSVALGLI